MSVGSASGVSGEARGRRAPPPLRGGFQPASQVITVSCMAYAVDVGHFTHFAFTVIFTHYVKTKPDSGFTVKSRTLEREDVSSECQRAPPSSHLDRRTLVVTKPGSRHLGRTCSLRGLAHTRARLQEAQRLVCAPPPRARRALLRRHGLGWPHLHAVRDA